MKKDASIIGVDLARQVFQLNGATETGEAVVVSRKWWKLDVGVLSG